MTCLHLYYQRLFSKLRGFFWTVIVMSKKAQAYMNRLWTIASYVYTQCLCSNPLSATNIIQMVPQWSLSVLCSSPLPYYCWCTYATLNKIIITSLDYITKGYVCFIIQLSPSQSNLSHKILMVNSDLDPSCRPPDTIDKDVIQKKGGLITDCVGE